MAATVKILQTTNISSKVAAVCSGVRKVYVTDVSTDGSVAVGKCAKKDDPGEWQVFLYSQSGGVKNLGTMGKKSIDNIHISADGLVIYGTFYVENEGSHIFRYTQTERLQDLGTMGKNNGEERNISKCGFG
jgi:probable HAF family extracellular repeat protein